MSARDPFDTYGVRRHNSRIGNPETIQRSARYYVVRDNVRMAVRLFLFLGEVLFAAAGFVLFAHLCAWAFRG